MGVCFAVGFLCRTLGSIGGMGVCFAVGVPMQDFGSHWRDRRLLSSRRSFAGIWAASEGWAFASQ